MLPAIKTCRWKAFHAMRPRFSTHQLVNATKKDWIQMSLDCDGFLCLSIASFVNLADLRTCTLHEHIMDCKLQSILWDAFDRCDGCVLRPSASRKHCQCWNTCITLLKSILSGSWFSEPARFQRLQELLHTDLAKKVWPMISPDTKSHL